MFCHDFSLLCPAVLDLSFNVFLMASVDLPLQELVVGLNKSTLSIINIEYFKRINDWKLMSMAYFSNKNIDFTLL